MDLIPEGLHLPPLTPKSFPFLLHILVELPASLAFFIAPSLTLSRPQPYAHAAIRQYAVLLLTSNLIALVFAFRAAREDRFGEHLQKSQHGAVDPTTKYVAWAFAVYHLAPIVRAIGRIKDGIGRRKGRKALLGPELHLAVHGACFVALAME